MYVMYTSYIKSNYKIHILVDVQMGFDVETMNYVEEKLLIKDQFLRIEKIKRCQKIDVSVQ